MSHLRKARHLKTVAAWSYSCNFASWVVSQVRLILHGTYGNFGHQQYYLIPKLLQRLANNRAITFFWYLRPGKEGSGNILMVSRSHSQLLCIACGFFESGTRIYLGFANWRRNNSVEHVKLHQRTLLKTTIQDAELGYEETAKSIAPGVDQAKLLVPTLLFSIPRIRKSPNCSLSAWGSTRWDSPRKHL